MSAPLRTVADLRRALVPGVRVETISIGGDVTVAGNGGTTVLPDRYAGSVRAVEAATSSGVRFRAADGRLSSLSWPAAAEFEGSSDGHFTIRLAGGPVLRYRILPEAA